MVLTAGFDVLVVACFTLTKISFLWYNVVGAVAVFAVGLAITAAQRPAPAEKN